MYSKHNHPSHTHSNHTYTETANAGHLIATITAKDLDSGKFGDQGIRYSLSGTGAELFHVDDVTGTITVAPCSGHQMQYRRRRDIMTSSDETDYDDNMAKNVNVTLVGHTGVIQIADGSPNTEMANNELAYKVFNTDDEMYDIQDATTISTPDVTTSNVRQPVINDSQLHKTKPGVAPCLDYESQQVYFLSYKVSVNLYLYRHIIFQMHARLE